ncbi:hypothetical protein E2C01_001833 [Portunus trituberculatus]|uniref:Uncharacterized protein n=1 Tax=Portunus trituberculatus TaxID=210409 RepID=A0A5B7CIL2_PORTR|nr:hypothetical protein [Portunus trituberculatus]
MLRVMHSPLLDFLLRVTALMELRHSLREAQMRSVRVLPSSLHGSRTHPSLLSLCSHPLQLHKTGRRDPRPPLSLALRFMAPFHHLVARECRRESGVVLTQVLLR